MQIEEPDVLSLERRFFNGLIVNVEAVEDLMSDDSLLIDVLSGSQITKSELITVLRSGQLKFDKIKPLGSRVRFYHDRFCIVRQIDLDFVTGIGCSGSPFQNCGATRAPFSSSLSQRQLFRSMCGMSEVGADTIRSARPSKALNELATEKGIKPAQLAIAWVLAKGLAFQLISDELHQFVRRDSFSKLRLPSHNSNAATTQAAGQTRSE